jgi:hypothetical protein
VRAARLAVLVARRGRGLELGAGRPPRDSFRRPERSLHGRTLPVAPEVRPKSRAEVARPPDVEHLLSPVAEEVDAGPRGCAEGEVALVEQASAAGGRERCQLGDRASAALLGEPDQREQELCRRPGIRQRPVAGLCRRVEKPRELRKPEAGDAAGQESPCQSHGVDHRRGDPPTGQELSLSVEEGEIEAGVVRHEDRVAGEVEKAAHRDRGRGSARQLLRPQTRQSSRSVLERTPRIDERLELCLDHESTQAHGADLADSGLARPEPRRLEVDDDVRCLLEEEGGTRWVGKRDEVSVPREAGIGSHDIGQQGAGEGDRRAAEGEEMLRRFLRRDRSAAFLHELHEAVGRV